MTKTPRELAQAARSIAPGPGEKLTGYGVMSAPFASGHLIATRHFPSSSFGPVYRSVWLRSPDGTWEMFTDVPPEHGCPRYFSAAIDHAEQKDVHSDWLDAQTLRVTVDGVLEWELEVYATARTRVMNAVARVMPERLAKHAGAQRDGRSGRTVPRSGAGAHDRPDPERAVVPRQPPVTVAGTHGAGRRAW